MARGAAWWRRRGLIVALVWLHAWGAYHFCRGFLLTRTEIHTAAECDPLLPTEQCFRLPRVAKRVIWVIIDALRIDFAAPVPGSTRQWRNQIPFLGEADHAAHLYLGRADPPTTTAQRLKALTTGGLPAFIEAGRNFDSDRVLEDNLLGQLARSNRSAVLLGDDTWLSLFDASQFLRTAAFPSFDVRDLHGVDNGVLRSLYDEVRRDDHALLIAHFLGVDHAGHRYHADHPLMAAKLRQMDAVLRDVHRLMADDDILMVMGDHGMTAGGDHGGSTDDEVSAALFFGAKRPLTPEERELGAFFGAPPQRSTTPYRHGDQRPVTAVHQLDLVPTVALLLGVPVPFSNLGRALPEVLLLPLCRGPDPLNATDAMEAVLRAVTANARQVARYLRSYAAAASLPPHLLPELDAAFRVAEDAVARLPHPTSLEDLQGAYLLQGRYLDAAAAAARRLWTTFDGFAMACGGALLVATALAAAASATASPKPAAGPTVALGSLAAACALAPLAPAGACAAVTLAGLAARPSALLRGAQLDGPLLLLVALRSLSVFSNSWIVAEDAVTHHFLVAAAALLLRRAGRTGPAHGLRCWAAFGTLVLCGRLGFPTILRRSTGTHLIDTSAVSEVPALSAAVALVALWATLAALPPVTFPALRSPLLRWGYAPLGTACCAGYWALSTVHGIGTTDAHNAAACLLAQALYAAAALALAAVPWAGDPRAPFNTRWCCRLYHLCVTVLYPLILVTGARYAHVFLLYVWQVCALVLLGRAALPPRLKDRSAGSRPDGLLVLCCVLLSGELFFATGHQNVFNLVNVTAGFVGVARYNLVACALLTLLNALGGHILTTFVSALVLSAVHLPHKSSPDLPAVPSDGDDQEGAAVGGLLRYCAVVWTATACSAACAAMMRRHLMVWTVFTPKWCFDGVQSLAVAAATLCLTALLPSTP